MTGRFIQIYNRTGSILDPTGALQSPLIDPTQTTTCFEFDYFIHSVGVGRIELSLVNSSGDNPIWIRRYSAGDMWHHYMINIPPQKTSFKVCINSCDHCLISSNEL